MTDRGIDSEANQECAAKVFKEQDTMENLWNSFIHNKYSAIKQPAVDANDYELEPALITMVQQNQFAGQSSPQLSLASRIRRPMFVGHPIPGNARLHSRPFQQESFYDVPGLRADPRYRESMRLIEEYSTLSSASQ